MNRQKTSELAAALSTFEQVLADLIITYKGQVALKDDYI